MEISDVRVKLIEDTNNRLRAVCSVTFDGEFVVRDIKVVDGTHGLFVAMPSRKLSVHCPQCRHKNHLRARFCNECGTKLPVSRPSTDANGRVRLHRDIAHPINPSFREMVQVRVIQSYESEVEAARQPGYRPAEFDEEVEEEGLSEPVGEPVVETPLETASDAAVDVTEEMTEYDALIAGLRGGSPPPRAGTDSPRPPQHRRGPTPQPAARPSGNRRNESDTRQRPGPSRPSPEPRRERSGGPPTSRPARVPVPVSEGRPRERVVFAEPAPPTAVPRFAEAPNALPPPPAAPRPATPEDEEDAPFGEGIL